MISTERQSLSLTMFVTPGGIQMAKCVAAARGVVAGASSGLDVKKDLMVKSKNDRKNTSH